MAPDFIEASFTMRIRAIAITFAIATIALLGVYMRSRPHATEATIWVSHEPYSVDPLDYDQFIHHVAFTSVLAPLVTQYHAGEFQGIIASSWNNTSNDQIWTFEIRKGMRFDDGTVIDPDTVRKSLTRIAYVLKERKSKAGLFESLVGIDQLATATSTFDGIRVSGDSIVLRFDTPKPNLLTLISFGLYGIAKVGDFDPSSGKWVNARKAAASGAYRIDKWDDRGLTLALRSDFPKELRHPNPFARYVVVSNPAERSKADLVFGAGQETSFSASHSFLGPNASNIAYVTCHSWMYPAGACREVQNRKYFRSRFYKELAAAGVPYTLSFFPLTMRDIHEMPGLQSEVYTAPLGKFDTSIYQSSLPFSFVPQILNSLSKAFGGEHGNPVIKKVPGSTFDSYRQPKNPEDGIDLVFSITGILIEDPDADIRFMIQSKEGIQLPDPTGRLHEIVSAKRFSPQDVNQQVWDDAIVWPLFHMSLGLWARKEMFNFEHLNASLPPTDVSWIGQYR